jgi:Holliday junction resolvase
MTKLQIDAPARLIHEAIQQLGWTTDPESLITWIKRLELGIPAEDEIAFIFSWLGKCSIVHKLDQNQSPPEASETYQVPDLFACFTEKAVTLPVLIEVKVSKDKKLSWKEQYFRKLRNYSSLTGTPIVVAWKFYSLWLLVGLNCFKKAQTNYHLPLELAIKNNLMSCLAGDFVYSMKPKVGLHFQLKKERLISRKELDADSFEENWVFRVEKAFFTDSDENELSELPAGLWPLFIAAEPVSEEHFHGDQISQSSSFLKTQACSLPTQLFQFFSLFLWMPKRKSIGGST